MVILALLGGFAGCLLALNVLLTLLSIPVLICLVIWHAKREEWARPFLAILSPITYLSAFMYRSIFIANIVTRGLLLISLFTPWIPFFIVSLSAVYICYIRTVLCLIPDRQHRAFCILFPATLVVYFYLYARCGCI